jgi:CRISPR-associated protein Csd1
MILQSLTRYYDLLADDPDSGIAPLGYSVANVSFALNLSPQGELRDVFPLFEQVPRGKKMVEVPRRMIVPEQVKRASNISANFLCDNTTYILGISDKGGADYAIKRFSEFQKFNRELLLLTDSLPGWAVLAFLETYDPASGRQHPAIAPFMEELLKGGNLVFMLHGSYVHEDAEIRKAWEAYKGSKDAYTGQCLVSGETAPIARLHTSLRGVRDAQPTGATLVGFNAQAYESYNRSKGQGLNSPVSEKAAFAYTTALNYLLSRDNPNGQIFLGDTSAVYWAESRDQRYAATFMGLFDPTWIEAPEEGESDLHRDRKAETLLRDVAQKVRRGQALDKQALLKDLDKRMRFYVLGLAPNAARVAVRFFINDPFEKIIDRMMQHYQDLAIVKEYENQPAYIPLGGILAETVSKKSSDQKAMPLLAGAVLRAILSGSVYPAALYYAILNRVRADMDDDSQRIRKINYVRAAVIKAFLIRKYHHQPQHPIQEVLIMSLNENSTQPAYVLGRLFAVLEKVQQEAVQNINATIKDRYFTSACASPASVFPVLLRLSQHHISKAEYGYSSDRRIQDILNLLDIEKNPIPSRLTLDEQGVFILGYYHQRAAFYAPRKDKDAAEAPIQSADQEN